VCSSDLFDVLKDGTKSLILRPLFSAYQKLKAKNKDDVSIEELRIVFSDSILIINNIGKDGIFDNMKGILEILTKHHSNIILSSGENPYEIHIPIFEDNSENRLARFRALLDVDETINPVLPDCYYKYWGLYYDRTCQYRVFAVSTDLLLDENFLTKEQYLAEWDFRYSKGQP
jgi:hypothetical protein